MQFDFKFLKPDVEMTENVYLCTKAVIEQCMPPYYDKEPLLRASYNRIRSNLGSCMMVRLKGVRVAHYIFYPDGDGMVLDDIYVYEEFRNLGIGTAIVRRCISETERPISAVVYGDNICALRLFMRCGFKIVEQQERIHLLKYETAMCCIP